MAKRSSAIIEETEDGGPSPSKLPASSEEPACPPTSLSDQQSQDSRASQASSPALSYTRLGSEFFSQSAEELSVALLNKLVVRRLVVDGETVTLTARICETEAYPGKSDEASHSFAAKKTKRNAAMFGPPGTSYVYNIYGVYQCWNVSSAGEGAAVLVRAAEPLEGLGEMRRRRKKEKAKELCSGPSKMAQALAIDMRHNGVDLCTEEDLFIASSPSFPSLSLASARRSKRIGLGKSCPRDSAEALLRFTVPGDPFLSAKDV